MNNDNQGGLSIHPYIGGTTSNLIRNVFKNGGVSKKHLPTFMTTLVGTLLTSPIRLIEFALFRKKIMQTKIEKDPIFVIGHWRSGTTHLHNVISQDKRLSYLTTLQALFPTSSIVFGRSQWLKNLLAGLLPEKRMMDNVKMGIDLPQEEEFSLSCITSSSHHCNHFPETIAESFDKYVLLKATQAERNRWKKAYMSVIRKATYISKGKQLVLKNPYNTARIKVLLEMFPNAKFIHIYRNPYNIYVSALHDFIKEAEEMALQEFSEKEFSETCFTLYEKLMTAYWETRELVPEGNLCEVPYEVFEKNPVEEIERIYDELGLEKNDTQMKGVTSYLDSLSGYKKNKYTYSASLAKEIGDKWGFAIEKMNYSLPPDILMDDETDWSCKMDY